MGRARGFPMGAVMTQQHTNDRPVVSDMLLELMAAAISGAIVGCMIGASIMWLAGGF
jgi:hypothetical protein